MWTYFLNYNYYFMWFSLKELDSLQDIYLRRLVVRFLVNIVSAGYPQKGMVAVEVIPL